jgi:hypothetical protein
MTSLQTGIKQNVGDIGYYISLGSLNGRILDYLPAGASVTGAPGSFSTAVWCVGGATLSANGNPYLSSLASATAGTNILKDMGKTVVSASRTFRKIQYVVPQGSAAGQALSTFGVAGQSGTTHDYLTGYIELGFDGQGTPAPVAHFGR